MAPNRERGRVLPVSRQAHQSSTTQRLFHGLPVSSIGRGLNCPAGGTLVGDELHERTCLWSRADARSEDCGCAEQKLASNVHGQAILYSPLLRISFSVESDYAGSGPFALSFVRTYNSVAVRTETLAGQWRHNYDRTVQFIEGQTRRSPTRSAPTGASRASSSPVRFGRPMRIFRIDWFSSRTPMGNQVDGDTRTRGTIP